MSRLVATEKKNHLERLSKKNILLLTATITPRVGVPNLKRIDPTIRLQDYKEALNFYLSGLHQWCDAIVFAENSNSDVSELRQLVEHQNLADYVEFIVFDGLDYPPHYDRGYGEFKLLDYAMANSQIINSEVERTVVWKVTGRYIIKNMKQIITKQPSNFDIYCNFRNYPKHWVDTFLMAWTPIAYQNCLKGVYDSLKTNIPEVPLGTAAEELLRKWFDKQSTIKFAYRFKATPWIDGMRGADNKGYSTDNQWKIQLRNILNFIFPWLWI